MKDLRFILMFLVFAGLASCSSDDDGNGPAETDRIVGKWKIQQLLVDGEVVPIPDCEGQSTVEFMANGNVRSTDFYEDLDTQACVSEVHNEQWENRGNNVYRFMDGTDSYNLNIIFSNNNNTMTVTDPDDASYSVTYIRI